MPESRISKSHFNCCSVKDVIVVLALICIIVSWLILNCQCVPRHDELRELTLSKLLYLYDPKACDAIHFYNVTTRISKTRFTHSIIWFEKNEIAAQFRTKMSLWLVLHVLWAGLGLANISQNVRGVSFYTVLLPFTAVGIALLVIDVIHAGMFLLDARSTGTEGHIFMYINSTSGYGFFKQTKFIPALDPPSWISKVHGDDTSWISLLLAYCSCRGIVQWVVNFWIVKDNFLEGLDLFRSVPPRKHARRKNTFV